MFGQCCQVTSVDHEVYITVCSSVLQCTGQCHLVHDPDEEGEGQGGQPPLGGHRVEAQQVTAESAGKYLGRAVQLSTVTWAGLKLSTVPESSTVECLPKHQIKPMLQNT